ELMKQTNEVMRIATLGEMEYTTALNASITAQSVFKMSADETADAFNYMNAVENATSLQLQDFAEALPIAAAPVQSFGGDIKELGILLTAMKQNGIAATQGANAIKASMQRLLRPSAQVRQELRQYRLDRKSTRLNSSHVKISYAVFCLKKKKKQQK